MVKFIAKCCGALLCCIAVTLSVAAFAAYYLYQVKDEGELYLEHAPGTSVILREADSGIAHIRGETFQSVAYA